MVNLISSMKIKGGDDLFTTDFRSLQLRLVRETNPFNELKKPESKRGEILFHQCNPLKTLGETEIT